MKNKRNQERNKGFGNYWRRVC